MTDEQAISIAIGGIAILIAVVLAFYVLLVIANWKIFKKFGEPGWKAIIPVYNSYISFKYTWKTMWFWVLLAASVVYAILKDIAENGSPLLTVAGAVSILIAVISFISIYKLSKAFNHGVGWFLGLIFLNPVFMLMLGFGSSRYVGNSGQKDEEIPVSGYTYVKPEAVSEEKNNE